MAQTLYSRIRQNAQARTANGAATLKLIHESVLVYRDGGSGDWTNLAWLVSFAEGADEKRIRAIIEATCGMRFKPDAKQPTGLRMIARAANEAAVDNTNVLAAYVEAGATFRSKSLEEGIGDDVPALLVKADAKVRTVEEVILAAVRKVRRDTPEAATDARIIAALNAALKAE